MISRALLVAGLSVVLTSTSLASATTSSAELEPEAREKLDEGLRLYELGSYDEAIEMFEQGMKIDAHPDFLYALGQAERRRGDCKKAIGYYSAFMRRTDSELQSEAASLQLERCRDMLAVERPQAAPREPAARDKPGEPRDAQRGPDWYADVLGGVLVGSGLVAAGIGTYLYLDAEQTIGRADQDYEAYADAQDASPRRTIGAITAGAGIVLLGAGIFRYISVASQDEPERGLAISVGPGESSVVWRGSF